MAVIIPRGLVARPVDPGGFTDLLPDASVEVRHVGENLLLEFSREPTTTERAAVVERCVTDVDSDELRACADDTVTKCQAFLDATDAHDRTTEQVRVLTEATVVILRLLLRRP